MTVTRRVTEAWVTSARANGAKAKAVVQTEEHKAKLRAAQQARRERERQDQATAGLVTAAPQAQKRSPGRPRKETAAVETSGEKRKPGRPRKQTQEGTQAAA